MTFNLTSRVSELGRGEVAGRPGNGRPMQYETSLASWYQYGHTGGTGALSWTTSGEGGFTANSKSTMQGITFDASRIVPTATENRPVNVAIPVILYLGLRA